MTYYMRFKEIPAIPKDHIPDVLELSKFIMNRFDIYMSSYDTYKFWLAVSSRMNSEWLDITYTPEGSTRELFLIAAIKIYCENIS